MAGVPWLLWGALGRPRALPSGTPPPAQGQPPSPSSSGHLSENSMSGWHTTLLLPNKMRHICYCSHCTTHYASYRVLVQGLFSIASVCLVLLLSVSNSGLIFLDQKPNDNNFGFFYSPRRLQNSPTPSPTLHPPVLQRAVWYPVLLKAPERTWVTWRRFPATPAASGWACLGEQQALWWSTAANPQHDVTEQDAQSAGVQRCRVKWWPASKADQHLAGLSWSGTQLNLFWSFSGLFTNYFWLERPVKQQPAWAPHRFDLEPIHHGAAGNNFQELDPISQQLVQQVAWGKTLDVENQLALTTEWRSNS